jgi:endonuclease/exonuclease/phosphatase family metal-dependent hydrolase
VFSRFEVLEASLRPHRAVTVAEYVMATKSMLSVVVEVPRAGRVAVINVHLSAGLNPVSDSVVSVRGRQIAELRALADRLSGGGVLFVLAAGDFNAGPEAAASNYDDIIRAGFEDAWTAVHGDVEQGHTWDPSNSLNAGGIHRGCVAQRCDHILLYGVSDRSIVDVIDCGVTCEDEIMLASGRTTNLSDHFGVAATLRISSIPERINSDRLFNE